jgi:hypothetical protein
MKPITQARRDWSLRNARGYARQVTAEALVAQTAQRTAKTAPL